MIFSQMPGTTITFYLNFPHFILKPGVLRGTWAQEGGAVLKNHALHTLDLHQWFIKLIGPFP